MSLRQGSIVVTKHGKGKVLSVNRNTYTIPLFIIGLTEGKYKGEKIALTESEIRRV